MNHQDEPQQLAAPGPAAPGESPWAAAARSHTGAQGVPGAAGSGGVPGSPPRLAGLAAVAAWEPCRPPLLLQPGAAVGVPGCGVCALQNTRCYFLSWKKRCVSLWQGRLLQPRLCVREGKVEHPSCPRAGHARCWEPGALGHAGFGCGVLQHGVLMQGCCLQCDS